MKRILICIFILILAPGLAGAGIQSAKYTEGGSIAVTMDSGKVMVVPDSMKNRHRRELQTWMDQGGTVAPFVPADTTLIAMIEAEADRRIAAVYDRRLKDQMLARANELLLNRIVNGSLTPAEQTELDAMMAGNAWIKSVRAAAAGKIGELASMTDQQKIDFDPATDINWPAIP